MQKEQNVEEKSKHPRVFISYSHQDTRFLNELHAHLDLYAFAQKLEYWDDTKIAPGALWKKEIQKALKATTVAILLVSADFLASRFIARNELPPLLKAAEQDGVKIFSIILRPCGFEDTEMSAFQSINPPSLPLTAMNKMKREAVWEEAIKRIKESVQPKLDGE